MGLSSFLFFLLFFFSKEGKEAKLSGDCERLVSNWLSWASVRAHTDMGQSDTRVVGFAQFAGCQMRLIVLPPQLVIPSSQ